VQAPILHTEVHEHGLRPQIRATSQAMKNNTDSRY